MPKYFISLLALGLSLIMLKRPTKIMYTYIAHTTGGLVSGNCINLLIIQ